MHELSVALEICRMAEERLPVDRRSALRRVGVLVGDDAGIEPANRVQAIASTPCVPTHRISNQAGWQPDWCCGWPLAAAGRQIQCQESKHHLLQRVAHLLLGPVR